MTRYSTRTTKKEKSLSYEKALNKFSLLTEKEFENIYLMKPEALTFDKSYIKKRKDPKYSYEYFKKLMNNFESSIDNFDQIPYSYECNFPSFPNQKTPITPTLGSTLTLTQLPEDSNPAISPDPNLGNIYLAELKIKKNVILAIFLRPLGPLKPCMQKNTTKSSNYQCKKF